MKKLFEVKDIDRKVYEEKIRDFLPDKIIDIHTHVWLKEFKKKQKNRVVKWPSRVADENPVEHLIETYRLMLPGKKVTPLIFNSPSKDFDTDKLNAYVARSAKKYKLPSLMLCRPEWSAEEFALKLKEGNFLGAKPYLTFAPSCIPAKEIRIFDFMPHHQLSVLNRHGKILILHIPRDARLKDPVNLEQMLEIESKYPNIKLVIAHVGRAYCPTDVGDAFKVLGKTEKMYFDICANTNATVFRQLIETVGPGRIIFGSDLPILRMRMRRICENEIYVNLVPKGLYGDVSGDKNMREVSGSEAKKLTFFLYEEILAFIDAAQKTGLGKEDIEKVFYSNAAGIIEKAAQEPKLQLHMIFPEKNFRKAVVPGLPAGYMLRTYRKGDEESYIKVMQSAGFENWNGVESVLRTALPEGIFFIVHRKTNRIVATACAQNYPTDLHPQGGVLGWVAVDPEHRGKKLGYIISMKSVEKLIKSGYRHIYLSTDDWRLAAINTYLKMGFEPMHYMDDMKKRWKAVREELSVKK
jgi:predicted TIM-barrel fold metal-dependent hydrolase/ribosomal protein S18 acetylase RimI-like enzyme